MNKKKLVSEIIVSLHDEMKVLEQSAKGASDEASANDAMAQSQMDNRALEAKRLAEVQNQRIEETKKKIEYFEKFEIRDFGTDDGIEIGALVKLEHDGDEMVFFVAPTGAGITVQLDGHEVEVISPKSPLGDALLACYKGEQATIVSPTGEKVYDILAVE